MSCVVSLSMYDLCIGISLFIYIYICGGWELVLCGHLVCGPTNAFHLLQSHDSRNWIFTWIRFVSLGLSWPHRDADAPILIHYESLCRMLAYDRVLGLYL